MEEGQASVVRAVTFCVGVKTLQKVKKWKQSDVMRNDTEQGGLKGWGVSRGYGRKRRSGGGGGRLSKRKSLAA